MRAGISQHNPHTSLHIFSNQLLYTTTVTSFTFTTQPNIQDRRFWGQVNFCQGLGLIIKNRYKHFLAGGVVP